MPRRPPQPFLPMHGNSEIPEKLSPREIAGVFLRLGCTSFGGPVAHLGYLHEEFVVRRKLLGESEYADLVALCQALPGPASSQLVFALGMRFGGLPGAMAASLAFTLPSAVLMILFAYGVRSIGDLGGSGFLHGLKVAAVAVVAQAVWTMGKKLCPDAPRLALGFAATVCALLIPGAFAALAGIALGALAGLLLWRKKPVASPEVHAAPGLARRHLWAAGALVLAGALLVVLPALATATGAREWRLADSFYRAGSLVFGGGHVVLPLLRAELVPTGFIADDTFLAGYGAAQAMPGPLFSFSGYLGAVIRGGANAWLGGLGALFALFLPAWLLIGGALPFWSLIRGDRRVQGALRGANAAVVGVLLAALWNPVIREGIVRPADAALALAAFATLEFWKKPSWAVVALCAAVGFALNP